MANSSLAAMYNQCRLCANTTIIAFQDKNGFIQIGNLTSGGWALTQLGPALDPVIGTGLALQPFYLNGSADQINLYHQRSDLNMSLASWKPGLINGDYLVPGTPSYLLLTLETQLAVGPSTNKFTTPSPPAHPSPLLPLIPMFLQVSKRGLKSCLFPTEALKSILGREQ